MKQLFDYISVEMSKIESIIEADADCDKWYELFVAHEDGSTETVERGDTFSECFQHVGKYFDKYRFDRMNIDIWYNNDDPQNLDGLFSYPVLFPIINTYMEKTGQIKNMKNIGNIQFRSIGTEQYIKAYNGFDGYTFHNKIAFDYFFDMPAYIPDLAENPNDKEEQYSYSRFLDIANNDYRVAYNMFDLITWQYPETVNEEWNNRDMTTKTS